MQTCSSFSKFLFFLEQGDLFVGFGPQIQYQFAFAKTLRGTHPFEIYWSTQPLETLALIKGLLR